MNTSTPLDRSLAVLIDQLKLSGVYAAFEYNLPFDFERKFREVYAGAALESDQSTLQELMDRSFGTKDLFEGKFNGSAGILNYIGVRSEPQVGMKASVCLFYSAAEGTEKPSQNLLAIATSMLSSALMDDEKEQLISMLQIGNRYQIVSSELLDWIRNCEDEGEHFFQGLLSRAKILTSSSAGAIHVESPQEEDSDWISGGLDKEHILQLAEAVPELGSLLHRKTPFFVNNLGPKLGKNATAAFQNIFIFPRSLSNGQRITYFLVSKGAKNRYSSLDELYLNQLLSMAGNIMDREHLLQNLKKSNSDIQKEREEQQKLIDKLRDAKSQLLQSEKMASIGQLAAGVAHEINNPIGFINSNISTLKKYSDSVFECYEEIMKLIEFEISPEVTEQVDAIKEKHEVDYLKEDLSDLVAESLEGIGRVRQIVQDLKGFSHVGEVEKQLTDINKGLKSTLNIVNNELKYKAKVELDLGDIPEVKCVGSQINQVFMNLLVNAGHAIESEGLITVKTWQEGDHVCISVADNGSGIKPENLEKLFEPFFTTKPIGKGTGLGLALSYGIIEKHQGKMEVESTVGKGTTFTITLPINAE